ncbi:MAG: DUF202 domain-containing protein [Ktedonobacteraceae bacterium]|nr:DUF202 domain-containing protein [Chloroflexota bacterium]
MQQKEESVPKVVEGRDASGSGVSPMPATRRIGLSKRVTDHLANERTFLAWVRTALAVMAFGFVVERFGLVLRELGLKLLDQAPNPAHYSSIIGITLVLLGTVMMFVSLLNFLHVRRAIDEEHFHPSARYAIILAIITTLIGIILAGYLFFTA